MLFQLAPIGWKSGTRTHDSAVNSRVLYRLSYQPKFKETEKRCVTRPFQGLIIIQAGGREIIFGFTLGSMRATLTSCHGVYYVSCGFPAYFR